MNSPVDHCGADEVDGFPIRFTPIDALKIDTLSINEQNLENKSPYSVNRFPTPVAASYDSVASYEANKTSAGERLSFSNTMNDSFIEPTTLDEVIDNYKAVPQVLERIFDFLHPIDRIVCTVCCWLFYEIAEERIDFAIAQPKNSTLLIEWSNAYTIRYFLRLWKKLTLAGYAEPSRMVKDLYASYEVYVLEILKNRSSAGSEYYTGLKALIVDMTPQPVHAVSTIAAGGNEGASIVAKPPRFQCNGREWARVIRLVTVRFNSASKLEHLAVFDSRFRNVYPSVHLYRELKYGELLAQMPLLRTVFMPSLQRLYAAEAAHKSIGVAGQAGAPLSLWKPLINSPLHYRLPLLERLVLPNSSLRDIIVTQPLDLDVSGSVTDEEELKKAVKSVLLTFPSSKCVVECGGMAQSQVHDKIRAHVFPQAQQFVLKPVNSHTSNSIRRTNLSFVAASLIETSNKELPTRFNELIMSHIEATYRANHATSLQLFHYTGKIGMRLPRHRFFIDSRDIVGGSFAYPPQAARKRLFDLDCLSTMLQLLTTVVRNDWFVCEATINWLNPGAMPTMRSDYLPTTQNQKPKPLPNVAAKILQTVLSFWTVTEQQLQYTSRNNGLNLILVAPEPLNKLLTSSPLFPETGRNYYHIRRVKFIQHIKFWFHFSNVEKLMLKFEQQLFESFAGIVKDAVQCVSAAAAASHAPADISGLRYAVYQHLCRVEFRVDMEYDAAALAGNDKLKTLKAQGCRVEPSSDDDDDGDAMWNAAAVRGNEADIEFDDDEDDEKENFGEDDDVVFRVRARGGVARQEHARLRAKKPTAASGKPARRDKSPSAVQQRRSTIVKTLAVRAPTYEKTLTEMAFESLNGFNKNALGTWSTLPLPRLLSVGVVTPPFVDVD